jgi:hypothetical protein
VIYGHLTTILFLSHLSPGTSQPCHSFAHLFTSQTRPGPWPSSTAAGRHIIPCAAIPRLYTRNHGTARIKTFRAGQPLTPCIQLVCHVYSQHLCVKTGPHVLVPPHTARSPSPTASTHVPVMPPCSPLPRTQCTCPHCAVSCRVWDGDGAFLVRLRRPLRY